MDLDGPRGVSLSRHTFWKYSRDGNELFRKRIHRHRRRRLHFNMPTASQRSPICNRPCLVGSTVCARKYLHDKRRMTFFLICCRYFRSPQGSLCSASRRRAAATSLPASAPRLSRSCCLLVTCLPNTAPAEACRDGDEGLGGR